VSGNRNFQIYLDNPPVKSPHSPDSNRNKRPNRLMISAEELLKPISPEKPCGDDLSYDPEFLQMDALLKGKPETQFSAAEDPNWKELREHCLSLWKRSKDLRVAATLTVASLKMEGFAGFRESLALLNGLVETSWAEFYPRLDPADGNDPTERVNIIASLAAPLGTFGDPLQVIQRVRETPLTNSVRMGRFSAADVLRSQAGTPGPDKKPPPSAQQISSAFKDTNPDDLKSLAQHLSEAIDLTGKLDDSLTKAVGATKAANLEPLQKELKEVQKLLGPYLPEGTLPASEEAVEAGGEAQAPGARAVDGEIRTRADVVRTLDRICGYYEKQEPSSPVPYLLKRAKRLVEKNFLDIINDLSPDALDQIGKITGQEAKAAAESEVGGGTEEASS
jgi:type VI secretion system protein ImpA